jgi:hypothetical protein
MAERISHMRRWILCVILAHVVGSYGTEFVDSFVTLGFPVSLYDRLIAPVHDLPWLVICTAKQPDEQPIPSWLGYLLPAALVLSVCAVRGIGKRRVSKADDTR